MPMRFGTSLLEGICSQECMWLASSLKVNTYFSAQ